MNPVETRAPTQFGSLIDAATNGTWQLCLKIIEHDPTSVNQKGWNGFAPLHKAALRNDIQVLQVLLDHGADPNVTNDFQETPLHYAARNGDPQRIRILVKHGADLSASDKKGQSVMHHAAQGHNVLGLHYLHYVHGIPFRVCNDDLKSPLHLVCATGNTVIFKYLIRQNRCDIHEADGNGNTSMHIAARHGHISLIWDLLVHGGCKMLHITNKTGHTPVDMAKAESTARNLEVTKFISFYASIKNHSYHPKGPVVSWWWHLFMPVVFYTAALLLGHVISWYGYSQGLIVFGELVIFIAIVARHMHRMEHECRWPNPVYAGTFAAGLFHTMFCFFDQLLPYVIYSHFIVVVSFLLTPVMVYMYVQLLYKDPGYITDSANTEDAYTIKDIANGTIDASAFCPVCEAIPPKKSLEESKHCRLCDRCVQRMDHHCLYLLNCVGKKNHRLFVVFIMLCLFCMVLFVYSGLVYFHTVYKDQEFLHSCSLAIHDHAWVLSMVVLNCGSIVWGVLLLQTQFRAIGAGHTTMVRPFVRRKDGERQQDRRVLSNTERIINILNFLTGKEPYCKEPFLTV